MRRAVVTFYGDLVQRSLRLGRRSGFSADARDDLPGDFALLVLILDC